WSVCQCSLFSVFFVRSVVCSFFLPSYALSFFFFHDTATTEIYTLSLHDALPIFTPTSIGSLCVAFSSCTMFSNCLRMFSISILRSEEHTSELQSRFDLVCRLLLEKKKSKTKNLTLKK